MQRLRRAFATVAGFGILAGTAGAYTVDGDPSDWTGAAPVVSGAAQLSNGELVYTDWLYDAWGANVDGFRGGQRDFQYAPVVGLWPNLQDPESPRWGTSGQNGRFRMSGDFGYPPREDDPRHYDMAADVAELRVGRDGAKLYYLIRTTALRRADQAVFAIGVDADGDAAGGLAVWPLGANLSAKGLGLDAVVTVWGTGGAVTTVEEGPYGASTVSTVSLAAAGGEVAVDLARNVIEISVPRAAFGQTAGSWRHFVIGGLWDAGASRWKAVRPYDDMPPEGFTAREGGVRVWYHMLESARPGFGEPFFPNVYQVLFRPEEPNTWWRDDKQAADLAAGSIADDFLAIDVAALGAGGPSGPAPRLAGPLNLVYRSPLDVGEGLQEHTSNLYQSNFIYQSKEQPYSVMLPSDYPETSGLLPYRHFLHYLNGNHNNWIWGVEDCLAPRRTHVNDEQGFDHVQALVDAEQLIVSSALARGGGVGYGGIGGADAIHVFDLVTSNFRSDPDRTSMMGMSMGAIGTSTLAPLYVDRLNAAVSYSGAGGGSTNLTAAPPATVANLRNIPYVFVNGDTGLDALLLPSIHAYRDALAARTYEHAYFEFAGRAHDYALVCDSKDLVDPWLARTRDPNPARVTYRIEPASFNPDLPAHEGAYWVSGMTSADGSAATADLTSHALAAKLPATAVRWSGRYAHPLPHVLLAQGLRYGTLAEFEAAHPVLAHEGWTLVSEETEEIPLAVPAFGNTLSGRLENLSTATVNLARAGLTTASTLVLELDDATAATATTLTFTGGGASSVTLDGLPYGAWTTDGSSVTITLTPGLHTYEVN